MLAGGVLCRTLTRPPWILATVLVLGACDGDRRSDDDDDRADGGPDGGPDGPDGGRDAAADPPDAGADPSGGIVFDPPSGTFRGRVDVSISTDIAGAEIRYSVDQRGPSLDSSLYDGTPIAITATTELRAQAFVGGVAMGAGTAVYVATDIDVGIDLPIVLLDDYGAGPLSTWDRRFVPAAFMSFGLEGGVASLSATPEVATRAGIHVRGQSTAFFDKTPIRVELRDDADEDADHAVLGMPAESDWALRAPFADKALIREPFLWDLGREMGMPAPRYAFCELYFNVERRPLSADDYLGVYLLVETVKNAPNRLDLQQLGPADVALPDITGGYIVKFEWLIDDDDFELTCTGAPPCWDFLKVHDPDPIGAEQEDWIASHLSEFDDVLHSADFADPALGYGPWIDVGSFVDQLIVNELGREMDAYIRSAYFYKDRDGVLFAGPLWDYNLTFGVGGYFENDQTAGWQWQQQRQPVATDWFPTLLEDPAFEARVIARWQELREGLLTDEAIDARIDALAAPLAAAAARNFARWPNLADAQIVMFTTPTAGTWEGQVEYMRDWIHDRVAWLDTQWR